MAEKKEYEKWQSMKKAFLYCLLLLNSKDSKRSTLIIIIIILLPSLLFHNTTSELISTIGPLNKLITSLQMPMALPYQQMPRMTPLPNVCCFRLLDHDNAIGFVLV